VGRRLHRRVPDAAALVAAGVPISATLLLALPGMAATAVVLTRHYGAAPGPIRAPT
jgi:hypothetical protein